LGSGSAALLKREVIQRTAPNAKNSVVHRGYNCHVWRQGRDIAGAVCCNEHYPARLAYSLISKSLTEFDSFSLNRADEVRTSTKDIDIAVPSIRTLLAQYSKPDQVDQLFKVQKDLDETKEILLKSIDQLLDRQEKLDDLLAKTNDLSFQSKTLVQNSEKLNRCCNIL